MEIINWDIHWFEAINTGLSSAFLDAFLPWTREPLFWIPFYLFIIAFVIFNFGKKGYWFLLFLTLTVSSSDIVSSRLIKKNVERLRPCNDENVEVIKRVRCGSGYSFTSSHATNHFAIASFLFSTLGIYFKKHRGWLWLWAAVVSFAQVYVGVHFPLDIFFGGLIGAIIGQCWAWVFNRYYGHTLLLNVQS